MLVPDDSIPVFERVILTSMEPGCGRIEVTRSQLEDLKADGRIIQHVQPGDISPDRIRLFGCDVVVPTAGPDYMQPGFVFCQPCRHCFKRIEFTRGNAPADFFCSDTCRQDARTATIKRLREGFKERLLKFLADNEAVIVPEAYNDGTAGCEIEVCGQVVTSFDGRIGEVKPV